jgi:hypothetical protein
MSLSCPKETDCVGRGKRIAGIKLLLGLFVWKRGACQLPVNAMDCLRYTLALVSKSLDHPNAEHNEGPQSMVFTRGVSKSGVNGIDLVYCLFHRGESLTEGQ